MKTLCRVLNVNRSSYYKHFNGKPSNRSLENQKIKSIILKIYFSSKKRLGVYKIHYLLMAEHGINISVGRVYRLFKSMNLPKMSTTKSFKPYTKSTSNNTTSNNILNRNFNIDAPNLVWKCSSSMSSNLVVRCLKEAFIKRNKPKNIIFHSDRGSQYTSKQFRDILDEYNITQSLSKSGCPYDNAVSESFFKFLKLEELNRKTFSNKQELELSLFEYIEGFYNSKRSHSFNDMLSPNQKEDVFFNTNF